MRGPTTTPPSLKTRKGTKNPKTLRKQRSTAQFWLSIVCLWPLAAYVLLKYTQEQPDSKVSRLLQTSKQKVSSGLRGQVKSFLSRWEDMGYGAHRPRVSIVVQGKDPDAVIRSVKSVYEHTDRHRILCVVVIFDGITHDEEVVKKLEAIDSGYTPHWHGLMFHSSHSTTDTTASSSDNNHASHGRKIHILFNEEMQGVSACRHDGAQFTQKLVTKHEAAGLKNKDENVILVFLRSDAALTSSEWVDGVTAALIVPPENDADSSAARVLPANAISFAMDGVDGNTGQVIRSSSMLSAAFDYQWKLYWSRPAFATPTTEIDPSYLTPVVSGGATAMTLHTFLFLPYQDDMALTTYYAADLQLSLALWLCGDGIDIIPSARVASFPNALSQDQTLVTDYQAAKILHTFAVTQDEDVYDAFTRARPGIQLYISSFPSMTDYKCRPFSWYIKNVLPKLKPPLPTNKSNIVPLKTSSHKKNKAKPQESEPPKQEAVIPKPKPLPMAKPMKGRKLSSDKLEILSHASPISLHFEPMYNPANPEHPHMGARDANGKLGYVHDATALRNNPPSFFLGDLKANCENHDSNYKMLTEKVKVDLDAHDKKEGEKRVKIFCIVYTIDKSHDRIPNIRQTWGQKCDGFMVASNKTDTSLNTVEIPHQGPEEYYNIWQKVRSIWSYVYDNYYNDYDFFHIGGDDLYVLVENLRLYLESDEIRAAAQGGSSIKGLDDDKEIPLFLGRRFAEQGNKNRIFNSGGSGYTINKAALKTLVYVAFPQCFPDMKTFAEDVMVASCFRKQGVFPYETRDDEGGERYNPFQPGHHLNYRPPENNPEGDWYVKYTVDRLRVGFDHCSSDAVAFHYIKGNLMKRIHAILYGYCNK